MAHILLVDDDLNFRRSFMIQLELEGYTVTEIERATQALTFLDQQESKEKFPDIVITDVRMPEMGGVEFATILRKKYPSLPILVISAFELPEELAGFSFLRKPFKINQLVDILSELIKKQSD